MKPKVDGIFSWADPRTLQFTPVQPFELDIAYRLILHSGILTDDKRVLKSDHSWELKCPRAADRLSQYTKRSERHLGGGSE